MLFNHLGQFDGGRNDPAGPSVKMDASGTVQAIVGGLERFQHRKEYKFTHHSWGLLLADVGLDDVRVGAVVTPTGVEASGARLPF